MKIKLLDSKCVPFKKHKTDAGWDLKCRDSFTVGKNKVRKVGLGICVEIPEGHVGLVFPRSGISTEKGLNLANVIGVIDSDYRGEVIAAVKNNGDRILRVGAYERICQLVVIPVFLDNLEITKELTETERGEGGFGSTNEETQQEENEYTNKEEGTQENDEKKDISEKITSKGKTDR